MHAWKTSRRWYSDMGEKTYDDGLRDGRIEALEHMQGLQNDRLETHGRRLTTLERVAWVLMGVIGFLEFGPTIRDWFG